MHNFVKKLMIIKLMNKIYYKIKNSEFKIVKFEYLTDNQSPVNLVTKCIVSSF